jgi:hypothetical protein
MSVNRAIGGYTDIARYEIFQALKYSEPFELIGLMPRNKRKAKETRFKRIF